MHSSATHGIIHSFARRTGRRMPGAPVAIALVSAALLSSCGESVNAPRAVVGPEALTLDLIVSPTGVRTTQTVTFRATARNQGNDVIVARYAAPACGLQIVVETASGAPFVTSAESCTQSAAAAGDTLSPGESRVHETGIGQLPAGSYRAYATFRAANGQAPTTAATTLVVQP